MKIGILSAGGDCPGINAAIRGVGKTAITKYGMEVIGFNAGFKGLIDNDYRPLTSETLSGILTLGGTILGTSRIKPFKKHTLAIDEENLPNKIKTNYKKLGLDCIVCIGGNGTQKTASKLAKEGLNVIGIPKTIDNDIWGTDITFGFDSAVNIITEAIDRLHSTANSHNRIMVIEVMGHYAGWLALYAGVAGGGDIILIPEIQFNDTCLQKYLEQRQAENKNYSIVVVAEGIHNPTKKSAAQYVSSKITEITGLETRETVLGYIQRGGSPSPTDRILATRYGAKAAELIFKQEFGNMVAMQKGKLTTIPLAEIENKIKLVSPSHNLIKEAKAMGVCFGDE